MTACISRFENATRYSERLFEFIMCFNCSCRRKCLSCSQWPMSRMPNCSTLIKRCLLLMARSLPSQRRMTNSPRSVRDKHQLLFQSGVFTLLLLSVGELQISQEKASEYERKIKQMDIAHRNEMDAMRMKVSQIHITRLIIKRGLLWIHRWKRACWS